MQERLPESIEWAPYALQPKARLGSASSAAPRSGALLKIKFRDGKTGYADCHPWPELGDLPLIQQLDRCLSQEWTPLLRQSLLLARVDAEARSQGKLLWEGLSIPRSHALWTDLTQTQSTFSLENCVRQGFQRIKIKIGAQLPLELAHLHELAPRLRELGLRVRLDLNGSLPALEVNSFFQSLEPILDVVDWVEDPTIYEPALWKSIEFRWQVRLALDRIIDPQLRFDGASVRVLKPAIQDWVGNSIRTGVAWTVTSYLDHPIGQAGAAWVAAQIPSLEDCGLVSHSAYELNSFSEQFLVNDGVLVPPRSGTGWGWDDLLEAMPWGNEKCRGGA